MFLSELPSFIAALLFAVHPIHTEAVSTTSWKHLRKKVTPSLHLAYSKTGGKPWVSTLCI